MKSPLSRRMFVKAGLAATGVAGLSGLAKAQPASPAFMWGALLHIGVNMWSDIPVD